MQYWQLLISQHLAGALGIAALTQNNGNLDMHEPTVLVCHTYCHNMLLAKKKYSLHMCKVKAQHFEVFFHHLWMVSFNTLDFICYLVLVKTGNAISNSQVFSSCSTCLGAKISDRSNL